MKLIGTSLGLNGLTFPLSLQPIQRTSAERRSG
jgi:hypothetical protein